VIAALVLAAGGSRRLGRPKQLERWGSTTLLDHVLGQVRRFPVDEIWVVLGAELEAVRAKVDLTDCGIIENPEWEEGLAASLRVGLDALTRMSKAEAAFIVLGDQPDLPEEVADKLADVWATTRHQAVVPKYRYMSGNPVLASRSLWPRLMSLEGDEGARRLLQAHPEWVEEVWIESLPPRDVDTQRDIDELRPRVRDS
jgi:molybdenum cofactor cytidylyltransferase